MSFQKRDNKKLKLTQIHFLEMKLSFIISLLVLSTTALFGQRIQDSHYSTCGYIDKAGRILDGSYRTIGYINSDGSMQDASYRTLGYVNDDGRIQNSGYSTIAYVNDDGMIQDNHYTTIGYIKDCRVLNKNYSTIAFFDDVDTKNMAAYLIFFYNFMHC